MWPPWEARRVACFYRCRCPSGRAGVGSDVTFGDLRRRPKNSRPRSWEATWRGANSSTPVVTVVGSAPRRKALKRGGAKPGDTLYVSGRLGGSALGLANLMEGARSTRSVAVRRHLYPEPRLELGRFLRRRVGASAAIDLSDGLSADAAKLAAASSVGLEIEASRVPRYRAASIDQAIHGGEEYELLFTARSGGGVPPEFEGLLLTRIGTVHSGSGVSLRTANGVRVLGPGGFRHF